MKKIVIVVAILVVVFTMSVSVAFANPPDAPGAGDEGDRANQAAGENPPLGADRATGGVLNNFDGNPAIGNVFAKIIEHHPLCDLHNDLGDH